LPLLIHYMMMLRRKCSLPAGRGGASPLWKNGGSLILNMRVGVRVLCRVCLCSWFTGVGDLPR